MKKTSLLCFIFLLLGELSFCAQDTLSYGKALNFPTKKYGISIGNSHEFTGVRINFADKDVKRINGINITFWFKKFQNENAIVNAISIGVLPVAGKMQPINIGLLGVGTAKDNLNGFSFGGLFIGSSGNLNGLSLSGLVTMTDGENSEISGIALSGFGIGAHKAINGIAIGGLAVGTDGNINGIASSLAYISCGKNFNGVAITCGYLKSDIYKGLAISGYSKTNQMNGFSLSLINKTKELHGLQVGLLNYAENNPKGFRVLPFFNLHLKKAKK